jgi:threonine/homoserine/homoserine lactone efflux protein
MLPNYPSLILFLTATITLNLIPGTDVLYIASQSMINKRQGILAVFGISTGGSLYVLATAFGLAGILQYSPFVFNLIKIVGAGYLLYLAWQLFTKKESKMVIAREKEMLGCSAYYKGIYTSLLNPKVGLFFLTFLPQFVDPAQGKVWAQLLSLGVCFIISGTLVNIMYAFLFVQLRKKFFTKMHLQKWLDKLTAFIFCAIAFKIITAKQNN